jgi:hypothetical protein
VPASPDDDPGVADVDASRLARQANERIAKAAEVQRLVAAMVGRAASPDGYVRAGYGTAQGLFELHLDPRAMRMPSVDLAATILRVADAARQDLARQTRQAVRETYGNAFDPIEVLRDPAQLTARLTEICEGYGSAAKDAGAATEQVRRRPGH